MAQLKITYKKSTIGYAQDQKDTVRSLGLRKLNQSVIHEDTSVIRGMVFKVKHLVAVEEVHDAPTTRKTRSYDAPATGGDASGGEQKS